MVPNLRGFFFFFFFFINFLFLVLSGGFTA